MADADPRRRVLDVAYSSVAKYGFAKTTVEDVAKDAGLSRATVYRLFPGGKDQLLGDMVAWEMEQFFVRLAVAVAAAPDFATVLELALTFAHREIEAHAVLQTVLATEPERLLPFMTMQQDRILGLVVGYLRPLLEEEAAAGRVQTGVDLDLATRYVATMGLSVMSTPGRVDLTDPVAVRDVVRRELLAGILRSEAAPADLG